MGGLGAQSSSGGTAAGFSLGLGTVHSRRSVESPFAPKEKEFEAPKMDEQKMDEQKFVMRVGMMSNCNVSIQSKELATGGMRFGGSLKRLAYRLICDKCKESQSLENPVFEGYKYDDTSLVKFCTEHQHNIDTPVHSLGRKFKEL